MEKSFPEALINKINSYKSKQFSADLIKIGAAQLNQVLDYSVILDRCSHEVHFYRPLLRHSARNGVKVFNNPFREFPDDNFNFLSLAQKIGINVPRTVALPSKEQPIGTTNDSFKNLIYPLNWDDIFDYIGFPAYIKPNNSNYFTTDFKIYNQQEFFSAYDITGSTTMLLQESIEYDKFYRCFVVGKKHVRIMNYNPLKPHHLRHSLGDLDIEESLKQEITDICIRLSTEIDLDFNSIEIAVKDNKLYAIEFVRPIPLAKLSYIQQENFDWIVDKVSEFLIDATKSKINNSTIIDVNNQVEKSEIVAEKPKRTRKPKTS